MSDRFDKRLDEAIARLPRSREPGVDLWPGIEARLDGPRRRWAVPASLAAALAGALALAVWLGQPGTAPDVSTASPASSRPVAQARDTTLLRQAALVDESYRAAVLAKRGTASRLSDPERQAVNAELVALDDAQARIREALETQPDGRYLLSLLAQTHAMRLDLINQLAGGPATSGGSNENGNA